MLLDAFEVKNASFLRLKKYTKKNNKKYVEKCIFKYTNDYFCGVGVGNIQDLELESELESVNFQDLTSPSPKTCHPVSTEK